MGFSEKYGMEFRRAKWDETPNEGLIRGHEWRIFPILHRRYLFADVEQFLLYDFYTPNGGVDEEVFAYSNRFNDERGLIVYHNKFADTRGWIKTSAAYIDKSTGAMLRKNLAEGIGLPHVGHVIFKDYVTQLEYIRSCQEIWEKGMYVDLGAYQCHAFMDWRFVGDVEWKTICDQLNGAGVPSMQARWTELFNSVEETKIEAEIPAKKKRAVRKTAAKAGTVSGKKEKGTAPKKKTPAKPASKAKKTIVGKTVPAGAKAKKKPAAKAKPTAKKPAASLSKVKKTVAKKSLTKKTKKGE